MSRYFKKSEFVCNGVNCFDKMDPLLLEMLNVARCYADIPFIINSSWRSEDWNRKINGAKNSSHLRGKAVDIKCTDSRSRLIIVDALLDAGFTRIGIAKTFIHCDIDESLPQEVIFLY